MMLPNRRRIAGVDEAGRGPLAGPVVAAAVILNPVDKVDGLADSKTLSAKKRRVLDEEIKAKALAWAVGRAEVAEIDQINILQATLLAMRRAVLALDIEPHYVLVDGNRCPQLPFVTESVVGGDASVEAISAASIVAKVTRDREMEGLAQLYPHYDFAKHKGYGTRDHLERLRRYGPSRIHRHSFRPVHELTRGAQNTFEIAAPVQRCGDNEDKLA